MSLVLNNLINKINNKIDAADSDGTSFSTIDLQRLSRLNTKVNGEVPLGTIQYRSLGHIPPAEDSAGLGQIVFVKDEQLDSDGRYYYRVANAWSHLITGADSDENKLIDSDRLRAGSSGGGGGPSTPHPEQYNIQGDTRGYALGGVPYYSRVQYVSFASDGNGVQIPGALWPIARGYNGTASSESYAFWVDGHGPATPTFSPTSQMSDVMYMPYANEDGWTALGVTKLNANSNSSYLRASGNSDTHVYSAGGYPLRNDIEKFQISVGTPVSATDVGNTVDPSAGYHCGQFSSSDTAGYLAGGLNPYRPTINQISYASDADAVDHGDLTVARYGNAHQSSDTYGYSTGGYGPNYSNVIDKWPFASAANATDVGDRTVSKRYISGSNSTTHGYTYGGNAPNVNTIDKFSFSTDGNATDVGDLVGSQYYGIGSAQD